jgi:3-methylcrotonyl-CoA carboxylase alpha subunit
MFGSLLIANRGEIARRIIRTARRLDIRTIAVFTEADRSWPHWREADAAVLIGQGAAADSYLSIQRIVAAARESGAEAVHPGYGFLSENAAFAEACAAAGLIFVGPPAAAMRAMGSKAEAKAIMARVGVPVVPGYGGERQDPDVLRQKAYETGYPVMIKAVAGGGGRGMRRVDRAPDFDVALAAAKREALAAFGDDRVLVERHIPAPRHIEVQVFADTHGNIVHLFERDCSLQRRHQKVIEEAPAPGLPETMRRAMGEAAVKAAAAVDYRGAGTVEFIADASRGLRPDAFYFMEMNTRLQVEHPVTEAVTGLDLVEWQLRVAAGEKLPLRQEEIAVSGHAIEARIYAEDPAHDFSPSGGRIWAADFPSGPGLRVDAGVEEGSVVGSFYDSLLAKVIATGADRTEALARLSEGLAALRIAGPRTNLAFLAAIAAHPDVLSGAVETDFIGREIVGLAGEGPEPGLAAAAINDWTRNEAERCTRDVTGPWKRTDAFEIGGPVRRTAISVTLDGRAAVVDLAWEAGGPRVLAVDGRAPAAESSAEVVWGGGDAFVLHRGRQLRVGFPDPLMRDPQEQDTDGAVRAPMPGRIVVIAVALGDAVAKGDLLFALEAMKMEHSVLAPLAGHVREVGIAVGMQVEKGAPAVLIEAEHSAPVD